MYIPLLLRAFFFLIYCNINKIYAINTVKILRSLKLALHFVLVEKYKNISTGIFFFFLNRFFPESEETTEKLGKTYQIKSINYKFFLRKCITLASRSLRSLRPQKKKRSFLSEFNNNKRVYIYIKTLAFQSY